MSRALQWALKWQLFCSDQSIFYWDKIDSYHLDISAGRQLVISCKLFKVGRAEFNKIEHMGSRLCQYNIFEILYQEGSFGIVLQLGSPFDRAKLLFI